MGLGSVTVGFASFFGEKFTVSCSKRPHGDLFRAIFVFSPKIDVYDDDDDVYDAHFFLKTPIQGPNTFKAPIQGPKKDLTVTLPRPKNRITCLRTRNWISKACVSHRGARSGWVL